MGVRSPSLPTQLSIDRLREAQLRAERVLDQVTARYGSIIGPASAFLRVSWTRPAHASRPPEATRNSERR